MRVIITFLEEESLTVHPGGNTELGHVSNQADDPWDALDMEEIATETGRKDGSVNHDHYIYGTLK